MESGKLKSINSFLTKVSNCKECSLKVTSTGTPREKDYYYYKKNEFRQKYAILLQNPGEGLHSHDYNNIKLMNESPIEKFNRDAIALMQWFSSNRVFFTKFFDLFSDYCLNGEYYLQIDDKRIEFNPEEIYKNIHIFDLIKCKAKTKDITNDCLKKCSSYLLEEIELLSELKLLFIVGSRAWNCFYGEFSKGFYEKKEFEPVSKVHGKLFRVSINGKNIYVIPLQHMAKQIYNNTLRNSYFDYLTEGLEKYRRSDDN